MIITIVQFNLIVFTGFKNIWVNLQLEKTVLHGVGKSPVCTGKYYSVIH